MSQYVIQKETLVDIASAIREKENSTAEIKVSEIAGRIRNLSGKVIAFTLMHGPSTEPTPIALLAEEGMTWEEWCDNDEYNVLPNSIDHIEVSQNNIYYSRDAFGGGNVTCNNVEIKPTDVISSDKIYYGVFNSGSF